MSCSCRDNKTKLYCQRTKTFAKNFFQNEREGYKYYLSQELEDTSRDGYKYYLSQELEDTSRDGYKYYLSQELEDTSRDGYKYYLSQELEDTSRDGYKYYLSQELEDTSRPASPVTFQRDFFSTLEKECQVKFDTFWIIASVTGSILVLVTIAFGRIYAVKQGRTLKDSCEIGKIIPYIDWDKIEALGIAGLALKSKKAANVLSDKEIALKVRIDALRG
ncbi:hypothetical protein ACHWQZ_G011857 [Mnemiopsis leidyi]